MCHRKPRSRPRVVAQGWWWWWLVVNKRFYTRSVVGSMIKRLLCWIDVLCSITATQFNRPCRVLELQDPDRSLSICSTRWNLIVPSFSLLHILVQSLYFHFDIPNLTIVWTYFIKSMATMTRINNGMRWQQSDNSIVAKSSLDNLGKKR